MFKISIRNIEKSEELSELSRLGYSHWWKLCDSYVIIEVVVFSHTREVLLLKEEVYDAIDSTVSFLKDVGKDNILNTIVEAYKEYKNKYDN